MTEFVVYMNNFYGADGIYPNKLGKDLSPKQIATALGNIALRKGDYRFMGDSVDRELIRDELIIMKVLKPDYLN